MLGLYVSWDSRRLDAVSAPFGDLTGVAPFSIHMPIAASKNVIFTCVIR